MTTLPTTPEENRVRVESAVSPLAAGCRRRAVFLVDGDRTLSPHDTSRDFLARAGIDPLSIKARFKRDGYTFDAFRYHADVHVALGEAVFSELAPRVAADVELHPGAIEFLGAARSRGRAFVVSAGIPRVWRAVLDLHGMFDVGVIGGIDPKDPFVFGRAEKGLVARLFCAQASFVVGVGDSDVDAELLERADHAVVVMNHHRNADLLPNLRGHPSVFQVVPRGTPHPGIRVLSFPETADLGEPLHFEEVFTCP